MTEKPTVQLDLGILRVCITLRILCSLVVFLFSALLVVLSGVRCVSVLLRFAEWAVMKVTTWLMMLVFSVKGLVVSAVVIVLWLCPLSPLILCSIRARCLGLETFSDLKNLWTSPWPPSLTANGLTVRLPNIVRTMVGTLVLQWTDSSLPLTMLTLYRQNLWKWLCRVDLL